MDILLNCAKRTSVRVFPEIWRSSFAPRTQGLLHIPNSTTIQHRTFLLLPFGLDFGLVGAIAYQLTRLKLPDARNVLSIFGPIPGTKESEIYPERVPTCIAHRGAGLDAPENTLEAFKNCIEQDCRFFEFDVRSSKDGKLILLHDEGLERLTGSTISDVHIMDWDSIKEIDVGVKHPNRQQFKEVRLCLLEEALDFLIANNAKMIIDIKGQDQAVIDGILKAFNQNKLHEHAAITCYNPFVLYQIRKKDPEIVGALTFRPYSFSHMDYDAENGPSKPRTDHFIAYCGLRCVDGVYDMFWRLIARWCGVSAVLLHKDIVSRQEIKYWQKQDIRCAGWCVNSPVEKLYWSGILKAPYLANTLLGEPNEGEKKLLDTEELPPARKTLFE